MDKKENIKKAATLLDEICQYGRDQINLYVDEKYSGSHYISGKYYTHNGIFVPETLKEIKVKSDPTAFTLNLLESFWDFFEVITKNIQTPLTNIALRPILELGYTQILIYLFETEARKKEIAIKYWLCTKGEVLGGNGNSKEAIEEWKISYKALIKELSKASGSARFEKFSKNEYPQMDFVEERKNLFKLGDKHRQTFIETKLKEVGIKYSFSRIKKQFNSLSLYIHINIFLIRNLKQEERDKTHTLRVTILLLDIGKFMLQLCNEKLINRKPNNIEGFLLNLDNKRTELINSLPKSIK